MERVLPWPAGEPIENGWRVGRVVVDRSLLIAAAAYGMLTGWLWWVVPAGVESLALFVSSLFPMIIASAFGHELAHAAMAVRRGYSINYLRMGARSFAVDWSRRSADIAPRDLVWVAAAGPLFNLWLAAFGGVVLLSTGRFAGHAVVLLMVNLIMVVGDLWPRRIPGPEPHPLGGTGYLTDGRLMLIGRAAMAQPTDRLEAQTR